MVCRIGVSVVDPFSQVVLINIPRSTAMMLGYQASYLETFCNFFFSQAFSFQSDRPTQYQETHLMLNEKKKKEQPNLYSRSPLPSFSI